MPELGAITLLSGPVGAGKSTEARILASRFAHGVHLDLDLILHHVVISGLDPEEPAQIRLGLRTVAALAASFHDSGFTVFLEGAVPDRDSLDALRTQLAPRPLALVVLAPPQPVSRERDRTRGGKSVARPFAHIDARLRAELAGEGSWLDTAHQNPTETADEVLAPLRGS